MWLRNLREHALERAETPLILCGDLNVAHTHLDSQGVPYPAGYNGCTPEERDGMNRLMQECELIDPAREAAGTGLLSSWWSPYEYGRKPGNGIRLDYILLPEKHRGLVAGGRIHPEMEGSDHCPVSLELDVPVAHLQAVGATATQKQLL
jgi:exodeoxyribonuclease-3